MESMVFKATWEYLSLNSHPTKSFQTLARIRNIQNGTHKQAVVSTLFKCSLCSNIRFDHVLMLIIHIQVFHPRLIHKYSITGDLVTLIEAQKNQSTQVAHGFIKKLGNVEGGVTTFQQSFMIRDKMENRVKDILNTVASKLQRSLHKKEQVYFHSTDIFRQITQEQLEQDSEEQLGEVEKQLEKLRIEDFGDVNANDKKFFIEWNGFIHSKRKEYQIIFSFQIPTIFVDFCQMLRLQQKSIPRINLVIHAWTLWSSGQITSNDVLKGLKQFDKEQIME